MDPAAEAVNRFRSGHCDDLSWKYHVANASLSPGLLSDRAPSRNSTLELAVAKGKLFSWARFGEKMSSWIELL